MSGSLMPSIPVQVLLKYNPPKMTIVYHFENKENEQYYHDIMFDRNMLDNESDEDIVSHLYMSEAYYFNPKCLKRHQVSPSLWISVTQQAHVSFTIGVNLRYHFYFILNSFINFNIPLFCVQVKRLVNKLKTSPLIHAEDRSPERHSIHGNSPSPVRHQGNMGSLS